MFCSLNANDQHGGLFAIHVKADGAKDIHVDDATSIENVIIVTFLSCTCRVGGRLLLSQDILSFAW